MTNYVSKKRIVEISETLNSREFQILEVLNSAKFMTTEMLRRQFFAGMKTEISAKRAANRTMKKLENWNLIAKLPRRIGGYFRENYGGSSVSIWRLTEVGYKILRLKKPELPPNRKRPPAPNLIFLKHELMISEIATRFREMENQGKISALKLQFEPKSWRGFLNAGKPITLKPDLFAKFVNGGYDEAYFLETDRATENLQRIFAKCQTYVSYFNTGIEEKISGLTPYIVWIVLDEKRREQILKMFREKMAETSVLFQVITENELTALIVGAESEAKNGL